jgi:hypothetical protein
MRKQGHTASIVLWLCIYSNCIWAQSKRFYIQPEIALQGCQIHGDSYSGYRKPGYSLGIHWLYKSNTKLEWRSGLFISERGAQHLANENNTEHYQVRLGYIDVPFLALYRLKKNYAAVGGLTGSVLWFSNEVYNYQNLNTQNPFKTLDLMLSIAMQKQVLNWTFELRSSNSIFAIRDFINPAQYINFGNPIANFFNRGLYNNIMCIAVLYTLSH